VFGRGKLIIIIKPRRDIFDNREREGGVTKLRVDGVKETRRVNPGLTRGY